MNTTPRKQPNIVLVLADNLGWGELGCYGGGALRGARPASSNRKRMPSDSSRLTLTWWTCFCRNERAFFALKASTTA